MNELVQVFNKVIANQTDAEKAAKLELCREYFTNAEFRKAMEDEVARLNGLEL